MNIFLNAKHWQLFLAMVAPMIIGLPLFFANIFSIAMSNPTDPGPFFDLFLWFPAIILIPVLVLHGWQWSIGVGLNAMLPEGVTMKLGFFKVAIIFPTLYIFTIIPVFMTMPHVLFESAPAPSEIAAMIVVIPIVAILHLFSIACLFYAIWFCAKTIKAVELQRLVKFEDYIGEFFLMWFNIIGIWILQPRINKVMNGESSEPHSEHFGNYDS